MVARQCCLASFDICSDRFDLYQELFNLFMVGEIMKLNSVISLLGVSIFLLCLVCSVSASDQIGIFQKGDLVSGLLREWILDIRGRGIYFWCTRVDIGSGGLEWR